MIDIFLMINIVFSSFCLSLVVYNICGIIWGDDEEDDYDDEIGGTFEKYESRVKFYK